MRVTGGLGSAGYKWTKSTRNVAKNWQKTGSDLESLNGRLKGRNVRGSVVDVGGSLYWRVTVTTPDGNRGPRRIKLALKALQSNDLLAETRIVELAAQIQEIGHLPDTLPWDAPKFEPVAKRLAIPVAQGVEALEADFWKGKVRTSAAERTWDRIKAETDRLPQGADLTMDLLVAIGEQQEPGSRTRLEFLKVSKRLAKLLKIEGAERLDELKTPYEPGVRDVPTEVDVARFLSKIDTGSKWCWPTWALATYGCRPSETFSLVPNGDGTARVLTVKRKGKDPTWRTALALQVSALEPDDRSVPWDVKSPTEYDSGKAKLITDQWGRWMRNQHPTLQLYDLRHAWAIRSISKLPSTSLAAKCMGHSLAVHHESYHRWIDQADIAAVAASLKDRG